ncbi:hypothetical protein SAMN04487995_1982 [Dyadobacter koreensis]|uniref:1,4-alpha-glucan branching enzyme n=1 Tax=Dyadobacter koreensis TaxID=408657 RepID=A0A1H6T2M9_9BACT|nr:hypothetical protein [Dyadobacter koreensis]SEI74353.1 hypothetical protein SAMN04487995_1982 [Dyadobacter koreensis]
MATATVKHTKQSSETDKPKAKASAKKSTTKTGAAKDSGSAKSLTTTDHKKIQKWVEARGGKPATVKGTEEKDETGILRIDFPGYSGKDTLEEISWDDFFAKFDESNLEFLYQEKTADGKESRFSKFVSKK